MDKLAFFWVTAHQIEILSSTLRCGIVTARILIIVIIDANMKTQELHQVLGHRTGKSPTNPGACNQQVQGRNASPMQKRNIQAGA